MWHRSWLQWIATALIPFAWLCPTAQAAALEGASEQLVRAATFEVVQLKPPEGAVQYERPLPMELLPYQQRTDKYRSIGTAFAIGNNRYVTAGHVIMLGRGSQFGPPALRDAAGNVYQIDKVLKYFDREDFVVFSLRSEPPGVRALAIGERPMLNDTVFAVGNALGEGIVIRDGVFTSETPEEMNGDWKWLRFTAAASPGNSGGPLIDQRGNVIGVVLRKSEAENLNYALSMDQIAAAPDGVGKIENREATRLLIVLDAAQTSEVHEQFKLPLDLTAFFQSTLSIISKHAAQAQAQLVYDNNARLFPNGEGSDALLHRAPSSPLPRFLRFGQDGVWNIINTTSQNLQLPANGFVRTSSLIIRLRAPDNVTLAQLNGDSKQLMDLLLVGYPLRRQIAAEAIKVTSLGKAEEGGSYTDNYGRKWQIRRWAVPYADLVLSALCLPTPEGYDVLILPVPSGLKDTVLPQQETLTNYLYLTMMGSLARWHEFLQLPSAQPKVFSSFKLDIDPQQHVSFRSPRFTLTVSPQLVKLSPDSILSLDLAFFRDGHAVVWDVASLSLHEAAEGGSWAAVTRLSPPEASLPENFHNVWQKVTQQQFPYNATVVSNNGTSTIRAVASQAVRPPGETDGIHYVLAVTEQGTASQDAMAQKLQILQSSFKELEQ